MRERAISGYTNQPPDEVQDLYLKLIDLNSFNSFAGPEVVADLRANRNLWKAVTMVSCHYPLLYLRDMASGAWNVDTVMILSSQKDDTRLELVAERWDPDEVRWVEGREASELLGEFPSRERILSVWFQ